MQTPTKSAPSAGNNARSTSDNAASGTTGTPASTSNDAFTRPQEPYSIFDTDGNEREKYNFVRPMTVSHPTAISHRETSNISGVSATTVDSSPSEFTETGPAYAEKMRRVKKVMDQCEAVGWPFRKKLVLSNLNLRYEDVPVERICADKLGPSLTKLSLVGNHFLHAVPDPLVVKLVGLKSLDLSKCNLRGLPEIWDLPLLKKLNLARNKLTEFPNEFVFKGIPLLEQLELDENKLSKITLPNDLSVLSKLEYLDMNLNKITLIPDELSKLPALKTIRIMNNSVEIVPASVCEMDLRVLDISSNPLIQPPLETCERGLFSMRRYYNCLRVEENSPNIPQQEPGSTSKTFMRKSWGPKPRKKKSFPASLCRSNMFRSVSEPTAVIPEVPLKSLHRSGSMSSQESEHLSKSLSTEEVIEESSQLVGYDEAVAVTGDVSINDTLKVIFVGMALSGKTSIIKRLIEGEKARIPHKDDRTIGVDIYQWRPGAKRVGYELSSMNTEILVDKDLESRMNEPVDVKFSVWDFAGQHVYHATHELFFSSQALYVLVWDMGVNSPETMKKRSSAKEEEHGAFKLTYDSSDEEDGDFFDIEQENRRTIRALEKDIDEKLNFWVECIQASAPGAAILPVASFDDYFADVGETHEAIMRCKIMKERLLKHEKRRIEGMKQRLAKFESEAGPVPEVAIIQKLLCPLNRPKLLFGIDGEDVVRVSAKDFTGFEKLASAIVNVATGRERGGCSYPPFRGHIGARIPRMRLQVRDVVRNMRERFKVVETGYFLSELEKRGVTNSDDVSDALHFLSNIGELSYFGEVIKSGRNSNTNEKRDQNPSINNLLPGLTHEVSPLAGDDSVVSLEKIYQYSGGSNSTRQFSNSGESVSGLDEFIFLNPRWLVAAIACVLRHDLTREIYEMRRLIRQTEGDSGSGSLHNLNTMEFSEMLQTDVNYPVISSSDMYLLWETKRFTRKAAERALQYSNNKSVTPFDFLQRVLVKFAIIVPVDVTIDRACIGGKDYAHFTGEYSETFPPDSDSPDQDNAPRFFFLPSLLGPEEPHEMWTFKTAESWKTTLCHALIFPDGTPPGLMERMTSNVLNDLYKISSAASIGGGTGPKLRLKETLCWRSAFYLRIAMDCVEGGSVTESIVDIFVALVDSESSYCVASESLGVGMRKLIISARGQAGDNGSKIWAGGYKRVLDVTKRFILTEYAGLEIEFQFVCPQCLLKRPIAKVGVWNLSTMMSLAEVDPIVRCRYGHGVDIRLITAMAGTFKSAAVRHPPEAFSYLQDNNQADTFPVSDLLKSVVLVGVWDESAQTILRVGSGFFVDRKRGFIITAGHTVMDKDTWREHKGGKIVIGVIPSNTSSNENVAVYRYFARIIAKDPSIIKTGCCTLDACVLQITTRMESDVSSSGKEIGDQPEKLLMNSPEAMKKEKFKQLVVSEKVELDETIRILGFNQGGEGLIEPGDEINRRADFARGYVVMTFASSDASEHMSKRFQPRSEIVVICPTIGGHSGGPCVNQQGEVIGILSRADPADKQRCYLVPSSEFNPLVKEAKRVLSLAIPM